MPCGRGQSCLLLSQLVPLLLQVTLSAAPPPAPPVWTPWTRSLASSGAAGCSPPRQPCSGAAGLCPARAKGILCSQHLSAAPLSLLPDALVPRTVSNSVKCIGLVHSQKGIFKCSVLAEQSVKKQYMKILEEVHALCDFRGHKIEIVLITERRNVEK